MAFISIDKSSVQGKFLNLNDWAMAPVLRAIAQKFKFISVQNFGFSGKDRPQPWQRALSKRYAKRVKRPIATLELSGRLLRSFRIGAPLGNEIEVENFCDYAQTHQQGYKSIPRRAFFPVDRSGNLTPYTQRVLETTAVLEIEKWIRSTKK